MTQCPDETRETVAEWLESEATQALAAFPMVDALTVYAMPAPLPHTVPRNHGDSKGQGPLAHINPDTWTDPGEIVQPLVAELEESLESAIWPDRTRKVALRMIAREGQRQHRTRTLTIELRDPSNPRWNNEDATPEVDDAYRPPQVPALADNLFQSFGTAAGAGSMEGAGLGAMVQTLLAANVGMAQANVGSLREVSRALAHAQAENTRLVRTVRNAYDSARREVATQADQLMGALTSLAQIAGYEEGFQESVGEEGKLEAATRLVQAITDGFTAAVGTGILKGKGPAPSKDKPEDKPTDKPTDNLREELEALLKGVGSGLVQPKTAATTVLLKLPDAHRAAFVLVARAVVEMADAAGQ